jgi:glycosyltransferase involved in cell wall biosynthesis
MRVGVLNTAVPFVRGGAELLAEKVVVEIGRAGHQAELLRLPFAWDPPEDVVDSMLASASTRIQGCDRVIALKFPTYLVPHDDMVVWLLHQFRQVYDLWTHPAGWPDEPRTRAVRELVAAADRSALERATHVFCNSSVTQDRLRTHLGIPAEVLLPPLLQDVEIERGPYGGYLLALGRISAAKRQDLAVAAMAHVPPGTGRLVVAGPPDSPEHAARLHALVDELGLGDRVEVRASFLSEADKLDLLSGARGVVYLPVDEDSFGYVTLEAAYAGRPVVTTEDSGGILTLVEDGRTGLVAAPDARSVAAAFGRLLSDEALARSLGSGLADRAADWGLSWPRVVGRLLA